MNNVNLIGRLTKEPKLEQTKNGVACLRGHIAVQRKYKTADGERVADFIPFVAWRSQAEFLAKYAKKGFKVAIVGEIQSSHYTKDNKAQTMLSACVNEIYILTENKTQSPGAVTPSGNVTSEAAASDDVFFAIDNNDSGDADLPFSL